MQTRTETVHWRKMSRNEDDERCQKSGRDKHGVEVMTELTKNCKTSTHVASTHVEASCDSNKINQSNEITTSLFRRSSCFMRVRFFVACLSVLQLVQVMGSGYSKSSLTSIERRYRLSAFAVGLLQSCFHIGNLSVILFVSYFGSKWHRPRAIAIGSLIMAVSSVLSAVPQLVGERYSFGGNLNEKTWLSDVNDPSTNLQPPRVTAAWNDEMKDFKKNENKVLRMNLTSLLLITKSRSFSNESIEFLKEIHDFEEILNDWNSRNDTTLPITSTDMEISRRISNNYQMKISTEYDDNVTGGQNVSLQDISRAPMCKPNKSTDLTLQMLHSPVQREKRNSRDDSSLYIFIAVGSILKGVGHTPLHPLGMSFIDDFATSRNSAVYIGVVTALSLLGPAFGFILGSMTTNIWVDSGWVDTSSVDVKPHDPAWVGAWWMGYLITALLLIIVTIPLSLFPRSISKEEEDDAESCEDRQCFSCVGRYCSDESDEIDDSLSESDKLSPDNIPSDMMPLQQTSLKREDQSTKKFDHELGDNNVLKLDKFVNFTDESAKKKLSTNSANESIESDCDNNHVIVNNNRLVTSKLMRSASAPSIDGHLFKIRISRAYSYQTTESVANKRLVSGKCHHIHQSPRNVSLNDFALTLKSLLKDMTFISITMGFVSLTSFLASSITYVSKYMESQFDLTASMANLLNGSVNLPMAVVGNVVGGLIIRRRNFNVKQTISLVLCGLTLTVSAVVTLLVLGCERNPLVGFGNNISSCARSCECDDRYFPVCDVSTNTTYRSPCYAGCSEIEIIDGMPVFYDCQCIDNINKIAEKKHELQNTSFSPGIILNNNACPSRLCWKELSIFLAIMGSASMAAGLAATPSTLTILRVVPSSNKAFAIGIVFVFTRVLAWIPAPVYVGSAIDTSCLVWTSSGTGESPNHQQRCEVYDKQRLRLCLFGCTCMQLLFAIGFYLFALYLVTHRHKSRGRLQHGRTNKKVTTKV